MCKFYSPYLVAASTANQYDFFQKFLLQRTTSSPTNKQASMLPPRRCIAATPSANASDPNLVLGYQTHAPPAIQLVTTAATFAGLENARLGGGQSTAVIGKKKLSVS